MKIFRIQLFHDFFTLAKGGIHPTAQAVTPALDGTGKVRTEDGINGRSQSLKDGKNRVRQVEKQTGHSRNRIIEYISDEVSYGCHKVVDHHKYIHNQVPQGHKDISNEGQCRHKRTTDNACGGNACTGKVIDRRHSRIEQGYKGDNQNNDPYNRTGIHSRIQAILGRYLRPSRTSYQHGCRRHNSLGNGHNPGNSRRSKFSTLYQKQPPIVHAKGGGYTKDNGGQPRPVIHHHRSHIDHQVKDHICNSGNSGQPINNAICNFSHQFTVCQFIDLC